VEAIKKRQWDQVAGLDERSRALCTVADKLSENPTRIVERDWEPLRKLGFDDAACLEVGHIVGMFNHLTRLADGFGLALDVQTQQASKLGDALSRVAEE